MIYSIILLFTNKYLIFLGKLVRNIISLVIYFLAYRTSDIYSSLL
jgi:hypothetical protein